MLGPSPLRRFSCTGIGLFVLAVSMSACAAPTESKSAQPAVVRLSATQLMLIRGEDSVVTAQVFGADERAIAGATVLWRSSAPMVVSVSGAGVVHSIYAGSATITATSGAASAIMLVSVTDPFADVPAQVRFSPATTMLAGAEQTVRWVVLNKWFDVLRAAAVVWSSDAPAVATVSADGVITGAAAGSATITARAGKVSGSATITVVPIDSVRIDGARQFVPGSSTTLVAWAVGGSGSVQRAIAGSWSSSDQSVAAFGDGGSVRAGRVGTATIAFTAGQFRASVDIISRSLPGVIAYVEGATGRVKFLTLDGGDPTTFGPTIATPTTSAALSPDGSTVAFDCGPNACLAAPDGSGLRRLRATHLLASSFPSWSANGRVLAVQLDYNSVVLVRDGNERSLSALSGVGRPHLSPDGSALIFECESSEYDYNDIVGLCVADLNNGPISNQLFLRDAQLGAWSRDGRIAFSVYDGLCVIDSVSQTNCQRLVWPDLSHDATDAAWSPFGSHLVVERRGELFLMEASGANRVRLDKATPTAGRVFKPSWGALRP